MKRKIVEINEEKCIGCGLCANACHEGAIKIINGKAKLIRDDYCDGLGDCLPSCPVDAIKITEKDVVSYDKKAVENNINLQEKEGNFSKIKDSKSCLDNWPCQMKLVSPISEFLNNSHLLICATCVAYSYASLHEKFMKNRVTIIGCPKLDSIDYKDKICSILRMNNIKSICFLKMEVPCCSRLEESLLEAIKESNYQGNCSIRTISLEGKII